jgi:hypothetical protein
MRRPKIFAFGRIVARGDKKSQIQPPVVTIAA